MLAARLRLFFPKFCRQIRRRPICDTELSRDSIFAEHISTAHLSRPLSSILSFLTDSNEHLFSVGAELKRLHASLTLGAHAQRGLQYLGLCVCLSVCLSVKSHLTSRMSNRAINEHAYLLAYERQKICGDLPETTAFKSYAAKHKRKSQLLIYGLPAVSFLHSTHGETSEATQEFSTTFSLAQNDAY